MLDRRRLWGAALATALLATPAVAQTPRYRNFELAIYCRVDDVRRMAEGDWLEKNFDALAKDLKIGKVYLETHRSRVTNDRETMLKVKRFFESRGIQTPAASPWSPTRASSSSSSATRARPTGSTSKRSSASRPASSTS